MTMQLDPTTGQLVPVPNQQQNNTVPPVQFTVNNPTPPTPQTQQFMTKEEVEALVNSERERVRQEEKNKLYPHIEEQQQQIAVLTQFKDEIEAQKSSAEQQAAEAERLRQEAEMDAMQRLEAFKTDSDRRFAELEAERDRERVLRQREQEFARVNEYRARRLGEETENIAPQLVDFIQGYTEEEIETSIVVARQKSDEMLAEFNARMQQSNPAYRPPVIPVSGTPSINPEDLSQQPNQVTLSPEDIAAMTPQEYAAYRPQILAAASQHVRNGGLYR